MDEVLLCCLIRRGNIWLYKVPGAVDPPLKNENRAAAKVLKSGERGSVEKKLTLCETFDVAEAELVDP